MVFYTLRTMRRIVHPPIAQTAAISSPSAKADGVSAFSACGKTLLLVLAGLATACPADAFTLDLPIVVDTHVDSRSRNGADNWNFGTDHTDKVVVNSQDNPTSLCRALFRLPEDLWLYAPSQIVSAKVYLYAWQDNSGDRGVTLFPLTTDFVEGTGSKYEQPVPVDGATWWTRDGTNFWTTPGGDFDTNFPVAGVKEDILDENYHDRFFHWDVTALLTNAAARTNLQAHGALLRIDENPYPPAGKQYWAPLISRDYASAYEPIYLPRVRLEFRPSIPRPNFGVPAFVQPGGTFQAEVEADVALTNVPWTAVLANDLRAWTGAVEQVEYGRFVDHSTALGFRLTIRVPDDLPPETFDFALAHPGGGIATNRHAVRVVQNLETNFYLLHYADPQVGGFEPTDPTTGKCGSHGSMREIYWHALAIDLINPRFLLDTGDELDNPYYAYAVSNYQQYVEAMCKSGVPVLATRGNNDDMIPTPEWRSAIGIETYAVAIGSFWVFQKDYVENDYAAWFTNAFAASFTNPAVLYRLFGQHFSDSGCSWLPPAGQTPDLMLVGHVHVNSTIQTGPYPILSTEAAFNKGAVGFFEFERTPSGWTCPSLDDVEANQFQLMSSGAVARISSAFACANDGTAATNSIAIDNRIPRRFWDGRVRFLMPATNAEYVVSNGEKLAEYSYNDGSNVAVVVRVDIAPDATTTVSIRPAAADQAPRGTPHAWLARYGLATNETGELFDEGDGVPAWKEYVADTDPTSTASCFRITAADWPLTGALKFDSSSSRWYQVLGCSNLPEGVWSAMPGLAARPGVGGPDAFSISNPASYFVYRLTVSVP